MWCYGLHHYWGTLSWLDQWKMLQSLTWPFSLWLIVSPTQAMTFRFCFNAYVTFSPTKLLLSPMICRRSLWPRITHVTPRSISSSAATYSSISEFEDRSADASHVPSESRAILVWDQWSSTTLEFVLQTAQHVTSHTHAKEDKAAPSSEDAMLSSK